MNEVEAILRRGANDDWSLGLTDTQIAQFVRYAELLVEWNATRLNLTRLTAPHDIAVKHFLDSLAVLKARDIPRSARVMDLGTGAGLPGLALKIARPDLAVTLLDGTAKKLAFCRAVADDLGLTGVTTLHARAEDAQRLDHQAAAYDLVLARAVAPLERLLPWCAPFVQNGGCAVALKGASAAAELQAALPMARRLGLVLLPLIAITLPEANETLIRQIVVAYKRERA